MAGPTHQLDDTGSEAPLSSTTTLTYTFPTYSEGTRFIRRHHCLRHPGKLLVLGMTGNEYVVQCNACIEEGHPGPAILTSDLIAKRRNQIVTTHLTVRDQQIDELAPHDIRSLLPVGRATNEEIAAFIRFCQAARLNPFLKEVYLVKYQEDQPASIVIGYQNYIRRGTASPRYRGHRSGVTAIDKEGIVVRRIGEGLRPGDVVWGAWIEIARAGLAPLEREYPLHESVRFTRDGKPAALWKTMPAMMIHKVALGRAFKEAFPEVELDVTPGEGYVVLSEDEAPAEIAAVIEGDYTQAPTAPSTEASQAAPQEATRSQPEDAGVGPAPPPRRQTARRFGTVSDFWAAVREDFLMGPPEVKTVLGMTLGEWLNAKSKEQGAFATWDDAYEVLVEALGVGRGPA